MRRGTRLGSTSRYMPLDILLDLPRVRTLRVLKRFSWASISDLLIALDDVDADHKTRNTLVQAIDRHVDQGHVERDASQPKRCLYRITDAGRAELARLLAMGEVNETKLKCCDAAAAREDAR